MSGAASLEGVLSLGKFLATFFIPGKNRSLSLGTQRYALQVHRFLVEYLYVTAITGNLLSVLSLNIMQVFI